MWSAQFTQADSAAVNQTWTRVQLNPDTVKYVNDTARAAGIAESFTLRSKSFTKTVGTTPVPMVQINFRYEKKISTDTEPFVSNFTLAIPKSLSDAVTTSRVRFKDLMALLNGVSNVDAEVDDWMAARIV